MSTDSLDEKEKADKPNTTVEGTVRKVIQSPDPSEPEQAEIVIHNAEPLYREVRIENTLRGEDGEEVGLKPGAEVEITVEAEPKDTVKKIPKKAASISD
jgi:hypothetical protein